LREGGGAEDFQVSVFCLLSPSDGNFVGDTALATASWLDGQTDTSIN
jgi:hypothetical protein